MPPGIFFLLSFAFGQGKHLPPWKQLPSPLLPFSAGVCVGVCVCVRKCVSKQIT